MSIGVHPRKSNPDNDVTPQGRKWLRSLPPDVRPISLVEKHPQIVNLIALAWDNPSAINALLTDLLVDARGGREDFAGATRHELWALHDYRSSPRSSGPQRVGLLLIAEAVLWLGVVWMISCWGYALLQVDWNKNLADVMANAVPFILFGGIGFAATYFLSWVLKKFAMRSAHHSKADPK